MKTAVSIPDDLFEAADRMARLLGVSRSELYRRALYEYLRSKGQDVVRMKLDEVYMLNPELSESDPLIALMRDLSLPEDDW